MDTLPFPQSHDSAVFDFSEFPLAPNGAVPGATLVLDTPLANLDATTTGSQPNPLLRKLLPWIGAQVAAAIGLGTCLAQAMPPVAATPILTNETAFALRLGEAAEFTGPVPSAIRDGFHLRLGADD